MNRLLPLAALLAFAGCTDPQSAAVTKALASPPGQLICSIQMAGGGAFTAGLIVAALSNASPTTAPLAVIATDAGKAAVDANCAKAAASVPGGVSGVPVSPPIIASNLPQVAIVAPAGPVAVAPRS